MRPTGSFYRTALPPSSDTVGADWSLPAPAGWMPSPPSVLKTARDSGVTNVYNTSSLQWRRWLGPAHRCLVPRTSFAEPLWGGKGSQWFAHAEDAPMFFAGIEVLGWTSVRNVKNGETTDDLFAFLTTELNAEVRPVRPNAMPAILTRPAEWEAWLAAPFEVAGKLQGPLPGGTMRLVDGLL